MTNCTIGIDVGTGGARAGVFDLTGRMLGQGAVDIRIWRPQLDFVEQSSDDIWQACCQAVRKAMVQAGISAKNITGIGFDATCSLVVLNQDAKPVTVSPSGKDSQNVIVWMDHRAVAQAERINKTGHGVLKYVGGVISPEMQTPKLLWLKEHMPETWRQAAWFFDLPDFLVFCATGEDVRSLCSAVCKWTYLGHEGRKRRQDVRLQHRQHERQAFTVSSDVPRPASRLSAYGRVGNWDVLSGSPPPVFQHPRFGGF